MSTQQTPVKMYDCISEDCKKFLYKDPVTNQYGSKTVYINESATSERRPKYQLGNKDTRLKCPYGISEAYDKTKAEDTTRKSLDISLDNPALKQHLLALDAQNKRVAFENCERWFKRKLTEDQIDFMYQPLVRVDKSGKGYTDTTRTKVNVANNERATRFYTLIEKDGETYYRQEGASVIKNGSRIVPVVEIGSLWFNSSQFGMTLDCTDVIVFPSSERGMFDFVGIDAKPITAAPAANAAPAAAPVGNPASNIPTGFSAVTPTGTGPAPMEEYKPPKSPHQ